MSMALVSHPHMVLIYSIRRINTSLLPLLLPCWLWVHAASYPFNLYCVIIPADTNCKVVKIGHYLGWLVGFDSSTRRPFFHFLLIIICIYIFTTISLESCNLAWSWDLLEPSIPLYWGCDGLWEGYPTVDVFFSFLFFFFFEKKCRLFCRAPPCRVCLAFLVDIPISLSHASFYMMSRAIRVSACSTWFTG